MNTIKAYQCDYCKKVYAHKDSAKSHERRCYYNPATRSCGSCAFLDLLRHEIAVGYGTDFQVCLMNNDLTGKLKTGCDHYHQAEIDQEFCSKINIPDHAFNQELALERLSDRIEVLKRFQEEHQAKNRVEETVAILENTENPEDLPW